MRVPYVLRIMRLARYLFHGAARTGSLYLRVQSVDEAAGDVHCLAESDAELDGLLTVFHAERSEHDLVNVQTNMPLFTGEDKAALKALAAEFEIDFLALAFTRHEDDVNEARQFLHSIRLEYTQASQPVAWL